MSKDIDLWRFIASRLERGENVMLLVVAESSGSSPGRAGYKMAVAEDGELIGSIGGGIMEVNLVEAAKKRLSFGDQNNELVEQVHRKNDEHASGMICSGRQAVITIALSGDDSPTVKQVIESLSSGGAKGFEISDLKFQICRSTANHAVSSFARTSDTKFVYRERLAVRDEMYIIGGGHCALALSELMSRLGFRISIFDDRPGLNTIAKNEFAHQIEVIESYEGVATRVPQGDDIYVVVMTLGYASDAVVIRQLIDHDVRYFGVLGSKAKMAALMKEFRKEGCDAARLARIRTPIGLPINSRTPEEIAVSVAAEIISVKNA